MKIIFNNTLKDTVKISHISCTQIGPKKFYCTGPSRDKTKSRILVLLFSIKICVVHFLTTNSICERMISVCDGDF